MAMHLVKIDIDRFKEQKIATEGMAKLGDTSLNIGDEIFVFTHEQQGGGFEGIGDLASMNNSEIILSEFKRYKIKIPYAEIENIVGKYALSAIHSLSEQDAILLRRKAGTSDLGNLIDEQVERFQMQAARPQQAAFRQKVLELHGAKCAITGVTIEDVLEAAHVAPFSRNETERTNPKNGILLRADFHRLFDRGLIAVKDDGSLFVSSRLSESEYAEFSGQLVSTTARKDLLSTHYLGCLAFLTGKSFGNET